MHSLFERQSRDRFASFGLLLCWICASENAYAQYVAPRKPAPDSGKSEKPDERPDPSGPSKRDDVIEPAPPPVFDSNPSSDSRPRAKKDRSGETRPSGPISSCRTSVDGSLGADSGFRALFWAVGMGVSPLAGSVAKTWAPGANFGLGLSHLDFPLAVGLDLGAAFWSARTDTMTVDTGAGLAQSTFRSQDQVVFADAWLRVQPEFWIFRPYVEGVVGGKFLGTSYTWVDGYYFEKVTKDTGSAFSYGIGAGLDTRLAMIGRTEFDLTLGFRFLAGPTIPVELTVNGQLGPTPVETSSTWLFAGITMRTPFLQASACY